MKLALAGLVGGFAFACSGPTNPGEVPPLAPRPVPVQPVPGEPGPTGPARPVPGAPDPLAPPSAPSDAGPPITHVAPPQFEPADDSPDDGGAPTADAGTEPPPPPPQDAGVDLDAIALPPIPDALPPDAPRRTPSAR